MLSILLVYSAPGAPVRQESQKFTIYVLLIPKMHHLNFEKLSFSFEKEIICTIVNGRQVKQTAILVPE